jgi:hypothetical protein
MQVWTSVKAIGKHSRAATEENGAQAGIIINTENIAGDEVVVKWDTDGMIEAVRLEELQALN